MKEVTFPSLFGVTPPADDTAPYAATYTIVENTNTDGSYDISTMDNVDNIDSGAPISVTKDFTDPTVGLTVEEAGGYDFDLTWNSTDGLSGPSGVYDVEYRDGAGGEWETWQSGITETGMQFTAIPGHSLYFRVRSKDRVDNEGQSAELGPYTVELETRKYYYLGGQRAAMRVVTASTNQVYYLHGDHLGSVSLTTDSSGAVVSQARYMPYGETRWITNTMPTDFGFTGQRAERGFGLLDFNARYFSPRLGRFISADSLVPNPGSPMDFDRYMYAAGNPLRYIDPTGHASCEDMPWECDENGDFVDPDPLYSLPTDLPDVVGGYWQLLDGSYSISSAYYYADERNFYGSMVDIPGVSGYQARSDFLYNIDGVGMQGKGFIIRNGKKIYIDLNTGHWEYKGRRVTFNNDGARIVGTDIYINNANWGDIKLVDATFRVGQLGNRKAYFSIASRNDTHERNTIFYSPDLKPYNGSGLVMVQDQCNGCGSRDFDMYVKNYQQYIEWLNFSINNITLYRYIPATYSNPGAQ